MMYLVTGYVYIYMDGWSLQAAEKHFFSRGSWGEWSVAGRGC